MSLISNTINRTITKLSEKNLKNTTKISSDAFYNCKSLEEVNFPDTLTVIEKSAFQDCSSLNRITWKEENLQKLGNQCFNNCNSLQDITLDNLNPYIQIENQAFNGTNISTIKQQSPIVLLSQGRILLDNKISDFTGFEIPKTVINITDNACQAKGESTKGLTSIIIPDQVEIIGNNIFNAHSSLSKIVVGSLVRKIGPSLCPSENVTTLIFKQPSDMYIELPQPGDGSGMAYRKSSYNISIYTDNNCIKNYNWSADNVVATFYPLAQAQE